MRDHAITVLLVGTGIRVSELCGLRMRDADTANHQIAVMGKGRKERRVPIPPRSGQAIWRHLRKREDGKGGTTVHDWGRRFVWRRLAGLRQLWAEAAVNLPPTDYEGRIQAKRRSVKRGQVRLRINGAKSALGWVAAAGGARALGEAAEGLVGGEWGHGMERWKCHSPP